MAPLAVTLGDPAGIGPEIVAKAWSVRDAQGLSPFFAIGDARAITSCPIVPITSVAEAITAFSWGLPIFDVLAGAPPIAGQPTLESAESALAALMRGIDVVRDGQASALATGPVSKSQLYHIGFAHPGQTEFIAERCAVHPDQAAMLLAGPGLKVVPVTIHMSLSAAISALSTARIVTQGRILAQGLIRDFGMASPRIAVAGLNPHAGEDGALGDEERLIIAPAIAQLQQEGIDATGPYPPDSLFTPRMRETYDAALCMYHDQALIPIKSLHVDDGVNMTLGLPVIRTSPDHGTAFGIAGKNKADPGAMIAALKMAASAAQMRARA